MLQWKEILILVGKGIFEKLGRGEERSKKAGGQKERRMERDWVGVEVVSANQAGTQYNK